MPSCSGGKKKKRQVLKELRIDEISGVDVPAQEGATVLLMKRADVEGTEGAEGAEGAEGTEGAEGAESTKGEGDNASETFGKAAALTGPTDGHTHLIALHGPPDGVELNGGTTSYNDGHTHPWVLSSTGAVIVGEAKGSSGEPHSHAVDIYSKAAGKEAPVAKHIERRAETLGATDLLPTEGRLADLLKSAGEGEDEEMTDAEKKQLEELTKRAERAELLAKLSDAEKAHLDKLPEGTRDAFLAKSADDRKADLDKVAKAAQDADPVVYTTSDGIELRKSAGTAMIAIAKSNDALRKRNSELDAELMQERLEKRAEAELGHMPGTATERAAMLKAIEGIKDDSQREAALKALKASDAAMSKAFSMSGHGGEAPAPGSANDELEKLAKVHHEKHPELTFEKAYDQVLQTQQGQELYAKSVN